MGGLALKFLAADKVLFHTSQPRTTLLHLELAGNFTFQALVIQLISAVFMTCISNQAFRKNLTSM